MCGISGYFARESVPTKEIIAKLLQYGEYRGSDSVGYSLTSQDGEIKYKLFSSEQINSHTSFRHNLAEQIESEIRLKDILLVNHRAVPETEPEVKQNDSKTMQPIIDENNGLYLVHNGSVSNFIVQELKEKYKEKSVSNLDSEAIIWAYLENGRNMKKTMEYLSGGYAFLMVDTVKNKLYFVCSHNPLYCGYVRGHGLFFSSFEEGIYKTISLLKGQTVTNNNLCVWEDYYARQLPANTISEMDIDSGMINEFKFMPRYIHPKYDPYTFKPMLGKKVLVAASGGLDSSTTLATLKMAGYNVAAVHFKYGHRGQEAEYAAIKYVTNTLEIPLIEIDIEENMKLLDDSSMLVNSNHAITTGTSAGVKTTVAWTCFRNGFFVSYLAALAEGYIIDSKYDEVYITGGWMQLTESGVYSDNSERFMDASMKFVKFASICGNKIKSIYGLSNLLKTEQYVLLNELGLLTKLSPYLVSCDRPKLIDGIPHNCSKDGKPACGSGLLSYWATKLSGLPDLRTYYEVDDETYKAYEPSSKLEEKEININDIIDKILIHDENKSILKSHFNKKES